MRKGAIDELDEIDANEPEDEDAEAGRCDPSRRAGPPSSRRGQIRRGSRGRAQLEPPGLLGFENAWPQPLSRPLRFSDHARASSSRKSSALSRFIWGMSSPPVL